jgi:hypothetical protein
MLQTLSVTLLETKSLREASSEIEMPLLKEHLGDQYPLFDLLEDTE